jgi:hypothetical protein
MPTLSLTRYMHILAPVSQGQDAPRLATEQWQNWARSVWTTTTTKRWAETSMLGITVIT